MLNALLQKLIKTGTARFRFVMAFLALSLAMLLILTAVQLQANFNDLLYSKTNQDSIANFLVINKDVNAKTMGATTLSDSEIAALKQQPFVLASSVLTPSRFKISAESVSDQIPFYTDLFFESVPDSFLDIHTPEWNWNDQSGFIPMVVPNAFLDMYNFGFAVSRGLPQLSQELVKNLPIRVIIRSNGNKVEYYGKVVGFSDRISSVLVPQNFMDWANAKFGSGNKVQPSRVVIKTNDPGNPLLTSYLKAHGFTTDADKTRFSKYRQVVSLVVNISWVTGAVMLLFALLIFTLFIQLTIASCKEEIKLLITLGAAPKQLQQFLMKHFFPVNIFIVCVALAILSVLQFMGSKALLSQHIYLRSAIAWPTIIVAVIMLLVLWLVNRNAIRKYIRGF